MQIRVEIRNVFGVKKAYPACATAQQFAELLNTKTLTHAALCRIERLGYLIVTSADATLEGVQ